MAIVFLVVPYFLSPEDEPENELRPVASLSQSRQSPMMGKEGIIVVDREVVFFKGHNHCI